VKCAELIIIAILFSATLVYAGVSKTDEGVEFYWNAPDAQEVYVVGTFNDWNTSAAKMEKDENGVWHKVIDLPQGEHMYKFYVDGNWVVDADNDKTKADGYGGSNSVVTVGELSPKAETRETQSLPQSISTTLNPKVKLNGRYYTKAITEETNNVRFMLNKPDHDINLKLNFELNQNMRAYTVMNINNIEEGVDMWKTHLNFKRTLLKLSTQYFSVNAFDGVGLVRFNDPLHLVGDMGQYHYNFGYDHTGVYADSRIPTIECPFTQRDINLKLYGLIADESGDNDSDVKAGRVTIIPDILASSRFLFGYGSYIYQTPVDGTSSQENVSSEFDFQFKHEFNNDNWQNPFKFNFWAEYYSVENKDVDSVTTSWLEGETSYLAMGIDFPAALKLRTSYKHIFIDLTEEITRNNFCLKADFNHNKISVNATLNYWVTDYPDSSFTWSDYYTYLEKTSGNGRWYQKYSDLTYDRYTLLGYDSGMLWNLSIAYKDQFLNRDYRIRYESNIAQRNFSQNPRFVESVFILEYDFAKNWRLYSNTRMPYYNDPFLQLETDILDGKDVFLSTFAQITYYLRDNIELSLGWGVNPRVLNQTTDEFYQGGREEFLESNGNLTNYLQNNYKGLGEKLRKAENALEDVNRIGLEAVLRF